MRIVFDIDDVIADTVPAMIAFYNDRFETTFHKKDFFTLNFGEVWGISAEETTKLMREFDSSKYFDDIMPIPGTELLKTLTRSHTLMLVTSRFPFVEEKTKQWIERFFPEVFQDLLFSKNHYVNNTRTKSKVELCQQLKADIFVDDSIDYVRDCSTYCRALLFDQPWNEGEELPPNTIRVFSWKDLKEKISIL